MPQTFWTAAGFAAWHLRRFERWQRGEMSPLVAVMLVHDAHMTASGACEVLVTLTVMAGRGSADSVTEQDASGPGSGESNPRQAGGRGGDHEPPNALWRYVSALRKENDEWRLRLVLHDFGLVWEDTPVDQRPALVDREPASVDPHWDAFLAAYVEHRCIEDGTEPPAWTQQRERHLRTFWYAGGCHDYDRVRTIVTTPITFEAHGIWLPREELTVV